MKPGTAERYLDAVASRWLGVAAKRGLTLLGAWRTTMRDTEAVVLWYLPTFGDFTRHLADAGRRSRDARLAGPCPRVAHGLPRDAARAEVSGARRTRTGRKLGQGWRAVATRSPRARPSRPACATGSAGSRSRRATSPRWSRSSWTSRRSREAGRASSTSTTSTWAPWPRPPWSGSASSASGTASPGWSRRRAAARRSAATPGAGPGLRQPPPQRHQVQPSGSEVLVAVRADGSDVVASVADHGPGIARGDQQRIFERFYKVDRARGKGGGTGLGLSIARHVVEAHAGRVRGGLRGGQGSTFSFAIPAARAAAADPPGPRSVAPHHGPWVAVSQPRGW